jgi:CheY-like chemotaxis protein
MSENKRVLVVDDSKSARLVLRRMLEKYALAVDTVESATAALDYLSHNRPHAIFMDHMMPGMDGFQAVKAIKANPATATIPVMMYTSKGGDLYLGQARALGAVGVLPKTVAPAQLFESLRKIGLVGERRSEERKIDEDGASERAEDIYDQQSAPLSVAAFSEPGMPTHAGGLPPGQLDQLRNLLEEQRVEFRKDVLLSMETVARQTSAKLQKEAEEQVDQVQAEHLQPASSPLVPAAVLAALLAVSLLTNLFMYRDRHIAAQPLPAVSGDSLAGQVQAQTLAIADLESRQSETRTQLHNSWATTSWAINQSLQYGYDEIALDSQRIDIIETLLGKLLDSGFSGKLVVETHAGEFCLLGDQDSGFRLPAPDLPVDQCEFVGNPVQAADTPSAQQSLRFANFVATTPLLSDDRIALEVKTLPRSEELAPYPEKSGQTSAQEWNRAAQANNRISIELVPAKPEPPTQ